MLGQQLVIRGRQRAHDLLHEQIMGIGRRATICTRREARSITNTVSVSNSLSGRDWELDQVPAVGDPTHMVQIGKGHRVSTGEGQRRVALQ